MAEPDQRPPSVTYLDLVVWAEREKERAQRWLDSQVKDRASADAIRWARRTLALAARAEVMLALLMEHKDGFEEIVRAARGDAERRVERAQSKRGLRVIAPADGPSRR